MTITRATIGRSATMKCVAKNLVGQKTVSWVRYRDVSLIAVGKYVYISDVRFKVLHEPHSDEWFLVIKSVSYKDQGVYQCQVNSEPPTTFKYRLRVYEPRTEILGEKELFVDYASSLNLTCLVKSPDPPDYIFWKKDDQMVKATELSDQMLSEEGGRASVSDKIHSDGVRVGFKRHWRPGVSYSSLVINKVNQSYSGKFECLPSNSPSKSIRVHVLKDNSKPAAIQPATHLESKGQSSSAVALKAILDPLLIILSIHLSGQITWR